jgi:tripartite-type tricarboxylate transporter receptor subunit TctC
MNTLTNHALKLLLTTACAMAAAQVQAETWPAHAIRLIVPGAAGSAADIPARLFAQHLSTALGQSVVVENRPGAGGAISARAVSQAAADGYTLMMAPASTVVIAPWALPDMKMDPAKDLAAIGMLAYTPLAIAVRADAPFKDLRSLLDKAKAEPNSVTFANPGVYTMAHLTTDLIAERTSAPLRPIPFNGFSTAFASVQKGDVTAVIDGVSPILAQARGGFLRIVGVTAAAPLPGLENVPLVRDTVSNTVVDGWFGLFAPKGVTPAVADRLSRAMVEVKRNETLVSALRDMGMYTRDDTPAAFAKYVAAQSDQWRAVGQNK